MTLDCTPSDPVPCVPKLALRVLLPDQDRLFNIFFVFLQFPSFIIGNHTSATLDCTPSDPVPCVPKLALRVLLPDQDRLFNIFFVFLQFPSFIIGNHTSATLDCTPSDPVPCVPELALRVLLPDQETAHYVEVTNNSRMVCQRQDLKQRLPNTIFITCSSSATGKVRCLD